MFLKRTTLSRPTDHIKSWHTRWHRWFQVSKDGWAPFPLWHHPCSWASHIKTREQYHHQSHLLLFTFLSGGYGWKWLKLRKWLKYFLLHEIMSIRKLQERSAASKPTRVEPLNLLLFENIHENGSLHLTSLFAQKWEIPACCRFLTKSGRSGGGGTLVDRIHIKQSSSALIPSFAPCLVTIKCFILEALNPPRLPLDK